MIQPWLERCSSYTPGGRVHRPYERMGIVTLPANPEVFTASATSGAEIATFPLPVADAVAAAA